MLLDQGRDLAAAGQHRHDRQAGRGTDFVDRIQVKRVARGHHQLPIVAANGKQRLAMDQLVGKILQQREIDFHVAQIDVLQPDFLRQRAQRRLFPDVAQRHRLLDQRGTVSIGLTQLAQLTCHSAGRVA